MQCLRIPVLLLCAAWPAAAALGQGQLVPAAEALNPPAAARLAALAQEADSSGWAPVAVAAANAGYAAYSAERLNAAQAWNLVDRWASLFAENEQRFVRNFVAAVEASRISRVAMRFDPKDRPLATYLDADTRRWLIGNVKFSDEFFSLLSPLDYVPQVFTNLVEIRKAEPARFAEYASLALAIALVYDLPPAPDWPHGQVSAAALPRKFPGAAQAFSWWVREDRAGRTSHRLIRLGADELKFVIDVAAPFSELEWA